MILIVDDDPSVSASLGLLLKQNGYASRSAPAPEEALLLLRDPEFRLVLQDMNFSRATSGAEGLKLLAEIRSLRPEIPVVLMTAWGTIALAVEGMKAGAADFVTKPWSNRQILQTVETALSLAAARAADRGAAPARQDLDERYTLGALVGNDPKFLRVLELTGRVAPTDAPVLITGESGTGKELVAEAIHRNGRRRDGPFVKVNLGGIPPTLFESEMFGHVKGAFTDARSERRGRFEMADGGTIFLDEIGDLDPSAQVKMLRVLQDRTYEVLGSSIPRTVDVRVVSATNRNIPEMVRQGRFREDLLYRLNLITIRLPALRERPDDVPLLARHFLDGAIRAYGRGAVALTPRAIDWLRAFRWPGNIRQLKQTIERAVLVVDGDRLDAEHFVTLADLESPGAREEFLPSPGAMTLDAIEKAVIARCLDHYQGNITKAADALGLSRAALYRRIQKHGLG